MISFTKNTIDNSDILEKLVKLQDDMLTCFTDIKKCITYSDKDVKSYTNVNTPQPIGTWDRVWDNIKNTQIIEGEFSLMPLIGGGIMTQEEYLNQFQK